MVEVKPRAWWLGERRAGLAIGSIAPPQVFSLPAGKKVKIRTADGVYQVKAHDETMPLGAFPVGVAQKRRRRPPCARPPAASSSSAGSTAR